MQITLTKEQVKEAFGELAVVELEEPVYAPYVQRGNFPVLVEKITCKGIRPVPNKNM